MAKYKTIPVIVDAVPYEFGLEDGFKRWNEYISADGEKFAEEHRSKKYPRYNRCYDKMIYEALNDPYTDWKPYLYTSEGMITMYQDDMIITDENGDKYPCHLDIFKKTYELIE